MNYYTSSCGRIELLIKLSDAENAYHSGSCDVDIANLLAVQYIADQINAINPELIAADLKEYGAWDEIELADHDANKLRLLWIACGNIVDDQFEENN
jgi:hypothetical protein